MNEAIVKKMEDELHETRAIQRDVNTELEALKLETEKVETNGLERINNLKDQIAESKNVTQKVEDENAELLVKLAELKRRAGED